MIEVRIRPERIEISGHAGYAEPGKDIVCAGVTALTQTLIQSIENLTEDEIEYRNLSEKSKTLVDSFFVGIRLIADEFPDYVAIM